MTDYTVPSGAGQLMIRDYGARVEFWARAGYSISWNNLRFNYTANGSTIAATIDMYDTAWHLVAATTVSTSQTVTFRLLDDTNTTSIGGPTTISHYLSRSTVPPPPDPVTYGSVTANSMIAYFTSNGDGGSAITRWELGWGTSASSPQHIVTSDGSTQINALAGGTTYYFWARGVNANGTGGWSARTSKATLPSSAPPSVTEVKQTSVKVTPPTVVGATSRQIGYGKDPNTPTTTITTTGTTISGLETGAVYYFRSRGVNASGTGPWSTAVSVRIPSGARIYTGGQWKNAIPYVKVNGVWKMAEPWGKVAGVWKRLG